MPRTSQAHIDSVAANLISHGLTSETFTIDKGIQLTKNAKAPSLLVNIIRRNPVQIVMVMIEINRMLKTPIKNEE